MRMMRKLLDNVGSSWDKMSKDVPVLTIRKGNGAHTLCTIERNQLYLHTMPYNKSLPIKQTVGLEGLTYAELAGVLTGMGYDVGITSEVNSKSLEYRESHTLVEVRNAPLTATVELKTFTSKLWERLYPIARLLESADYDIDVALQQMLATVTRGKWLEYWASFFGLRRVPGELDESLRKRIFMVFANIKTNTIAIEELVRYIVQDDIKVLDKEPALMEIVTHPKYMEKGSQLHLTLIAVKGAGIDYILNFMNDYEEDYRDYYRDRYEVGFKDSDHVVLNVDSYHAEKPYRTASEDNMEDAFELGTSLLGEGTLLYQTSKGEELQNVILSGEAFHEYYVKQGSSNYDQALTLGIGELGEHNMLAIESTGDILDYLTVSLEDSFHIDSIVDSHNVEVSFVDTYGGWTEGNESDALNLGEGILGLHELLYYATKDVRLQNVTLELEETFSIDEYHFGSKFELGMGELGSEELIDTQIVGRTAIASMQLTTPDGTIIRESNWY